ncbi:MAG: HDOD domain-containing protein [bacterium]|nr:HDOD domain-containing protein [bacterium]
MAGIDNTEEQDQRKKVFVARQPIFDRNKNIYGYELLFRNGLENFFDESLDKDFASSKVVLDSFLLFDFKELTRGKRAFLNFTSNVLLSEAAFAFPTESIIVELLETVEPEPEIVAACQKLKKKGYLLALDDFEYHPRFRPLIDLTDIIKVDFLLSPPEERRSVMEKSNSKKIRFLAEKVETNEEYQDALDMGYSYFQGYYFSKPVIVAGKEVPSYKMNLLQILKEMQQPEISVVKLEKVIARDVSLSYKLLRFINSAAFGFVNDIHSIRHALNLLGIFEFKKWMSLVLLSQMGSDKPNELLISSLIRAKFCEMAAESISQKHRQSDFFLMGLMSLIDAFLDRPMADILQELPISSDIKGAIQGANTPMGRVLDLIVQYEHSDWEEVGDICHELNLSETKLLEHYFTSIKWANDFSEA